MRKRWAEGDPIPDDKHGTYGGYHYYRCRCGPCKAAQSAYMRALRAKPPIVPSPEESAPGVEWLPVVGWEGYYEVSNTGLVRSVDRVLDKAGQVPFRLRGQLLKLHVDKIGRPWARFSRDDKKKMRTVSTLVLEAFVGLRPDGTEGCHNDGNPANNHLSNLRWDTRRNNIMDAVRHGTHQMTRKTQCKWGHPYNEENTHWRRGGRSRSCRKCNFNRHNGLERSAA